MEFKQIVKSCFVGPGIARRTITGVIIGFLLFAALMWAFQWGIVLTGGTL